MPRTGSPVDGVFVEFAQIFGTDERSRLKQDAAHLSDISTGRTGWKARISTTSWQGRKIAFLRNIIARVVSFIRRDYSRGLECKLLSAYTSGFQAFTIETVSPRTIAHLGLNGARRDLPSELDTPLGFRIAAAMNLAGACDMEKGRNGRVGMKKNHVRVDDEVISRMDYLVNQNPHRLAFEFIAERKRLPNGYMQRVLVPWYMDRLTTEARLSEDGARCALQDMMLFRGFQRDQDITFEMLMDMRNSLDHLIRQNQRKVSGITSRMNLPRGEPLRGTLPESVSQVTVGQVMERGQAPRQSVRDYLVQEVRREGVSRAKAREVVVAALESCGIEHGSLLTAGEFRKLAYKLNLFRNHSLREITQAYLGLVSQLKVVDTPTSEENLQLLRDVGIEPQSSFQISSTEERGKLTIIERPQLTPPSEHVTYTCNEDELWLIREQVDRSYSVRITKDMAKRMMRWASRNKRIIAVKTAAKLSTALVMGAMSGGIGGLMYLAAASVTIPLLIGLDAGWGAAKHWWYSKKVKQYDQDGQPSLADRRNCFYHSLTHIASEQTLLDCFNAYADLKDELKGLDKIAGDASRSAADQVKFRRHQVRQQLRSSLLGESLENFDRMMTETITDISEYEEELDKNFHVMWKFFAIDSKNAMSEDRRLRVFNEAAHQVLAEGTTKLVREDQREWLKTLAISGKDSHRISDRYLFKAFGHIQTLPSETLKSSIAASAFNKLVDGTKGAFLHSARVLGHFMLTNITWSSGRLLKSGVMWFMKKVAPSRVDLMLIPTAALLVYWMVSFFGGRSLEGYNNRLNRLRVGKTIDSRTGKGGQEVTFDAKVDELNTEGWRALRREAKHHMKEFSGLMNRLRTEHEALDRDLKKMSSLTFKDVSDSDEHLVAVAKIILRRKHLEHEVQTLLSGAVGHFYQETIRGEWLQRQILQDKEKGLPSSAAL